MYPEYKTDLEFCKKIHRAYGKSFYFGTKIMTPEYRDAICVLYAFFRLPDEYVDTQHKNQKEIALVKLNEWRENWRKCFHGEVYTAVGDELKTLRATKYVFDTYQIPFEYSESFIEAMIQDTSKTEYQTYEALEGYMYGSASVVGLMMVHIIAKEHNKKTALEYAKALGEAFQMTNFLRDIYDDVVERDRVYVPIEDMNRFGVTKQDLVDKKLDQNFVDLLTFEIQRTRELYKKADKGLALLPKKEAKAIYVARVLYSKILDKIEACHYDVFSARVHVGFFEKMYWAFLIVIKKI